MTQQPFSNDSTEIDKTGSWAMFDRVACRYDFLNRVLSFGQDILWRSAVVRQLPGDSLTRIADIATGTGDQLVAIMNRRPGIRAAVGIDMSWNMLDIHRRKISGKSWAKRVTLVRGDGLVLPLQTSTVDAVTITFGIRNLARLDNAFGEMLRILRPGGSVFITEFSTPPSPLFRPFYLFYLRHILPAVGSLVSGDSYAYRYLNRTIESFPSGDAFCRLLSGAGFVSVSATPLTMGIATIYRGVKACS